MPSVRSRSVQRRAHKLPTAHPGERSEHEERSQPGSRCSASSITCRTTSTDGALTGARHPRGLRPLGDVRLHPSPADSLVEGSRDDGVVVPNRLGRLPTCLHGPVEVVEVLGRERSERHFPTRGRSPLDLCPVGPEGCGGEVEPLALFEPRSRSWPKVAPTPSTRPEPAGR